MICSSSSYFDFGIKNPVFVSFFFFFKMCFWAECLLFRLWPCQQPGGSEAAAPGVYSAGAWNVMRRACSFFFFWVKHNVEYCPQNLWAFLFLSASLKARVFGLNTASGAPFEELLLCVEMTTGMSGRCCTCGWGLWMEKKEAYLKSFLQTRTWWSSPPRPVPLSVFSFTLITIRREDPSVQSGCPSALAFCSLRKYLTANDIAWKNIGANHLRTTVRGIGSEIIAHYIDSII